jgi:hypothetical protein
MFQHQSAHQLSTHLLPFSYSTYPALNTLYHTTPYLPPLSSVYPTTSPSLVHPMESEYYKDQDSTAFGVDYATMAGPDIPSPHYC